MHKGRHLFFNAKYKETRSNDRDSACIGDPSLFAIDFYDGKDHVRFEYEGASLAMFCKFVDVGQEASASHVEEEPCASLCLLKTTGGLSLPAIHFHKEPGLDDPRCAEDKFVEVVVSVPPHFLVLKNNAFFTKKRTCPLEFANQSCHGQDQQAMEEMYTSSSSSPSTSSTEPSASSQGSPLSVQPERSHEDGPAMFAARVAAQFTTSPNSNPDLLVLDKPPPLHHFDDPPTPGHSSQLPVDTGDPLTPHHFNDPPTPQPRLLDQPLTPRHSSQLPVDTGDPLTPHHFNDPPTPQPRPLDQPLTPGSHRLEDLPTLGCHSLQLPTSVCTGATPGYSGDPPSLQTPTHQVSYIDVNHLSNDQVTTELGCQGSSGAVDGLRQCPGGMDMAQEASNCMRELAFVNRLVGSVADPNFAPFTRKTLGKIQNIIDGALEEYKTECTERLMRLGSTVIELKDKEKGNNVRKVKY
jgi:hypothetical protein